MKRVTLVVLFLFALFLTLSGFAANAAEPMGPQNPNDQPYLDLSHDQFVKGGIPAEALSDVRLKMMGSTILFSLPYEARVRMFYRSPSGKNYQDTGKIHAGVPIIWTILSYHVNGDGTVTYAVVAKFAQECGNPFLRVDGKPLQATIRAPMFREEGQTKVLEVGVVKPELVFVDKTGYVERFIPKPTQVNVNLPEKPGYHIEITGSMRAEKRWDWVPDTWDRIIGVLNAIARPLAALLSQPTRLTVTSASTIGDINNANTNVNTLANTNVVNVGNGTATGSTTAGGNGISSAGGGGP